MKNLSDVCAGISSAPVSDLAKKILLKLIEESETLSKNVCVTIKVPIVPVVKKNLLSRVAEEIDDLCSSPESIRLNAKLTTLQGIDIDNIDDRAKDIIFVQHGPGAFEGEEFSRASICEDAFRFSFWLSRQDRVFNPDKKIDMEFSV